MEMTTLLHRYAVRPHHVEAWRPLWEQEVVRRQQLGLTTRRAFLETDAEPKLSWLQQAPTRGLDELMARVAADEELARIAARMAPHVFRNVVVRPVEPLVMTTATAASIAGSQGRERIAVMRRYSITGGWEDFLALWRDIVPVREKYGFRCLFAVADREKDLFTWAFDLDGEWADFGAAQRDYYRDPQRVALRRVFDHMADYSIHPARQLLLPGAAQDELPKATG